MITYDFTTKQWCTGIGACSDCTLQEAQLRVCSDIEKFANDLRYFYCSATSPYEASSWTIKRAEAEAYSTGGPTPMLSIEAATRGIGVDVIVAKILANATQMSQLEAVIAGVSGKHRDVVNAFTNVNDVLDYDWSPGWPTR